PFHCNYVSRVKWFGAATPRYGIRPKPSIDTRGAFYPRLMGPLAAPRIASDGSDNAERLLPDSNTFCSGNGTGLARQISSAQAGQVGRTGAVADSLASLQRASGS